MWCVPGGQVGGLGVKDYAGRIPNKEQLGDVVCQNDPKPGFTFVLDNFAELLDDTFLQNLTANIVAELARYLQELKSERKSVSRPITLGRNTAGF
jgi:hypothetical protein